MATYYAVPAQKLGEGYAKDRANSNVTSGNVRVDVVKYTVPAGTLAIADKIVWRNALPKGARVLPQTKVYFAAGTASSTINLGDGASAARYLAATSVASAGSATAEAAAASGATYEVGTAANDEQIVSTVAGAVLAAGQVITLHLYWVQ